MIAANQIILTEVEELWRTAMPNVDPPDAECLSYWIANYPPELIKRGIWETKRKALKMAGVGTPMSAFALTKYCASVMRNAVNGWRRPRGNRG